MMIEMKKYICEHCGEIYEDEFETLEEIVAFLKGPPPECKNPDCPGKKQKDTENAAP